MPFGPFLSKEEIKEINDAHHKNYGGGEKLQLPGIGPFVSPAEKARINAALVKNNGGGGSSKPKEKSVTPKKQQKEEPWYSTARIERELNKVGPALDNAIGGIDFPYKKELGDWGRQQEKRGWDSLWNPFGPQGEAWIPSNKPTTPVTTKGIVPPQPQAKKRPPASGTIIKIDGVSYDTGYHREEIEKLRSQNPGGGNAGQSQSLDKDAPSYTPPTGEPLSPPPAPPAPPENPGERQNAAGIKQQGKKLSSSEMSSMGLMDGGRFWEESGPASGDAPPKKSVGGMYGNRARNAARAAFLDTPGSMAGYKAMQRASGIDINAGANIGGVNYQWQDGLSTKDKRAAIHAWTGGVNNTREGTEQFAQQFLKDYVGTNGGNTKGTPLDDMPQEQFIHLQNQNKKGQKFHPAMTREQFIDFQREVPEESQQISF